MAISKTNPRKATSQNPIAFYKLEQHGGAFGGKPQKVPEELKGGPMLEKIMGRKDLGDYK
jgi:hypothetical protein